MSLADGLVGAETCAVVHPKSNGKLKKDVAKLSARPGLLAAMLHVPSVPRHGAASSIRERRRAGLVGRHLIGWRRLPSSRLMPKPFQKPSSTHRHFQSHPRSHLAATGPNTRLRLKQLRFAPDGTGTYGHHDQWYGEFLWLSRLTPFWTAIEHLRQPSGRRRHLLRAAVRGLPDARPGPGRAI